jgi:hypothetical protein
MKLVIAVAAVLVVGAVALGLLMSGGTAPTASEKRASGGTVVPTGASQKPIPTLPADPSGSAVAATGSSNVREYMVGDTKIRDHRSGSNVPRDIPVNPHPANARELPAELTHDISQQVKRAIYECAAQVAKEVKGDKPKVVGQLVVAVKDHKLSITNMALETRDINDDAAAATLKQCSQDKSANFTSVAKDQDDVTDYAIQLNFAIP